MLLDRRREAARVRCSAGRIGITLSSPSGAKAAGLLVSALEENSLGFDAGLFVGDTVLALNGELAASHEEAIALIDKLCVPSRAPGSAAPLAAMIVDPECVPHCLVCL